ncbi:MAG: hypothetical protein WCN98_09180 [Verrucomicrobiaceae bacterium]
MKGKGFFDGWDYFDATAMIGLLLVFAVFAWECMPSVNRTRSFCSTRLVLSFLALSLCAASSWLQLNGIMMPNKGINIHSDMHAVLHLAEARLTGGFIIFFVMTIIHSLLWLSQRKEVHHKN